MTNRVDRWHDEPAKAKSPPSYLTQSIALEESDLPRILRAGVMLIGGMLFIFIAWAACTHLSEVTSVSGQVIPSGYVQSVQHLEGGIVKDILVHDGDMVKAGQVLIQLDNTSADADLGQMRARQQSLQAQAERLRRFASGDANAKKQLSDDDKAILSSMEESRASQRQVLKDQIAQKQKELQALIATHAALEKNVALMEKENTIHQNLAQKGYGSELLALTSERQLNQMKGQLDETVNQENRARDAISEAEGRLQSLDADLKQQAMKTLGDVEAQLAELTQTLEKYEGTANRTTIVSPVRGIVKGLSVHTIGAVIEQGKVLLEIVPVGEELKIEALIPPNDVGQLQPGEKVKVKVSAYDYSRYGSVPGHLESVSATTFQGQDGHSFYKALIDLDSPYVGQDPQHNQITPGMTVQADIITGDKTIMQYLLKPIYIVAESAFHER
jgi:HlyD family secretion protein/adhesin transport system membrane fusion protein